MVKLVCMHGAACADGYENEGRSNSGTWWIYLLKAKNNCSNPVSLENGILYVEYGICRIYEENLSSKNLKDVRIHVASKTK